MLRDAIRANRQPSLRVGFGFEPTAGLLCNFEARVSRRFSTEIPTVCGRMFVPYDVLSIRSRPPNCRTFNGSEIKENARQNLPPMDRGFVPAARALYLARFS